MSNNTADAIIIGGGVIGTSIALHLARAGVRDVLLIERQHLCSGTTGQSGAIIRQHYSNTFTAAMARDSLHVFRNWGDTIGHGDPRFQQVGVLITVKAEDVEGIRANVAMQQSLGIDTHLLTPDELGAVDARIAADDVALACWEPTAGYADAAATVYGFAAAARAAGARVREGVAARAVLHTGERVTGVETSAGVISAPVVVNAANIWGIEMLRAVGLELPVKVTRHPMAALRRPLDASAPHPAIIDMARMSYYIPRPGEITLVGSLVTPPGQEHVDPNGYAQGVTQAEIAGYQAEAVHRLPCLGRAVVQGGWAGIYDELADDHPVLDEVPGVAGYFCAVGMSGNCFKLAPVIGALMARRITAGRADVPELHHFRATRFAEGQPIGMRYGGGVLA